LGAYRQIEEIYHMALDREPSQRSAFLRDACQSDEERRLEVESMLRQGRCQNSGPKLPKKMAVKQE
jgi:hypothetical protein